MRNAFRRVFVGLEDFVAMKLFAGEPQDLVDAKSALEAAPGPPNKELLEGLAKRYGTETARSLESLSLELQPRYRLGHRARLTFRLPATGDITAPVRSAHCKATRAAPIYVH